MHFVRCKINHGPSTWGDPRPQSLSVLSGKENYSPSRERARDHRPCRLGLCNQAAVALSRGTEGGKQAFVSRATSAQAVVEAGAEEQGSQPGQEHESLRDFTRIFPLCVFSGNSLPLNKPTNKTNMGVGGRSSVELSMKTETQTNC